MKRPLLGYILLIVFVLSAVYAFALGKESLTTAEGMPFAAGVSCMVVLWYWMLCNLIANRKKMTHRLAWGFFLLFANWIAAIVYFFVKYAPAEQSSPLRRFRDWMVRGGTSRSFHARIALVCLVAAILHHVLTGVLYRMIPLHDYPVYHRSVGALYFPFTQAILLACRALSIDTGHPSKNLILVVRTMRFLYTYLLILAAVTLAVIRERRKGERAAGHEGERR